MSQVATPQVVPQMVAPQMVTPQMVAPQPTQFVQVATPQVVTQQVQPLYRVEMVNGIPTYVPVSLPAPEKKERQRRVITNETVNQAFTELAKFITDELKAINDRKAADPKAVPTATGAKTLRSINSRVKKLEADVNRLLASSSKRTRRPSSNPNGGFRKLLPITDAMADFAQQPHGSSMSRIQISKILCGHIANAKLKDEQQKRFFRVDAALASILQVEENKSLTYCDLQRYLKNAFKEVAPSTSAPVAATSAPVASASVLAAPVASAAVLTPEVIQPSN